MANTTTTPFMLLVLGIPEVEIGPEWAEEIVTALGRVDSHDHTEDNGVQITPAGMNINADLEMNGFALLECKYLELANQGATAGIGLLYRIGNNLWYNNAAGVPIQITTGTVVNAPGSGVISADSPASYPYTVLVGDAQKVLLIDTSAARTINLPAATTTMFFILKDQVGLAQTNNISVVPNGTDVIDGSNSTYLIDWNYGSIGLVSDGVAAWFVV